MSQPEPLQAAELPPSISLDERLRALDVADDKIGEILESTRVILENLVKDGKAVCNFKIVRFQECIASTLYLDASK